MSAIALTESDFWARVTKNGPVPVERPDLGPCWLWTGSLDQREYGRFGKRGLAHRMAYEYLVGPAPKGLEPDHLCRVHRCVNPAHIEWVTHRENLRRGDIAAMAAHRRNQTHCKHGHSLDPASGNVRIETAGRCRSSRRCLTCKRAKDARRRQGAQHAG